MFIRGLSVEASIFVGIEEISYEFNIFYSFSSSRGVICCGVKGLSHFFLLLRVTLADGHATLHCSDDMRFVRWDVKSWRSWNDREQWVLLCVIRAIVRVILDGIVGKRFSTRG